MRTHITRFRPLLADRTAWNKLWRRSFWDEHAGRFPEGVLHEDIPVILPAHLAAHSVDVLATPTYHWRLREGGAESITQRRLELRVLRDRFAAVEHVRAHFAEHGSERLCREYDASLLADDLRRHLVLLDRADAPYRAMFFEGANRVLEDATPRMLGALRAIDRLKWHLVGRGLEDELLEVLRFERADRDRTPPLRRFGRYYGDYPFREDAQLAIPRSIYKLGRHDHELTLHVELENIEARAGRAHLSGSAYLAGAPVRRTTLLALAPGRLQSLRLRTVAKRFAARPSSPFEASIDVARVCGRGDWRRRRWRLFVYARAGFLRRRRGVFRVPEELIGAHDLAAPDGVRAQAHVSAAGAVTLDMTKDWIQLEEATDEDRVLDIALRLHTRPPPSPRFTLTRRSDGLCLTYDLTPLGARVPLRELFDVPQSLELSARGSGDEIWDARLEGDGRALPVALGTDQAGRRRHNDCDAVTLIRTRRGDAALVAHHAAALVPGDQRRSVGKPSRQVG